MSVASGCVWGLIGFAVAFLGTQPVATFRSTASSSGAGLLAAPLIGVLMGLLSRSFGRLSIAPRIAIAGISLYGATLLVVVVNGLMSVIRSGRAPQDFWFNSLATAWASLVLTGFFLVLWPLAYITHLLVSRAWEREAVRTAG
jgi:hypothetical protein